MRQEVTRKHKHEKWALDDVVMVSDVLEIEDPRKYDSASDLAICF